MLWIIILVCIVCILIVKCTYSLTVENWGTVLMAISAIIGFCILLSNPLTVVDEGKKSTYNISEFTEVTLHNSDSADDTTYYTYVIDDEKYKIGIESDDIYSIGVSTSSQPSTVTIQKNTYRRIATFFTTEMYCYTFE